MTGDFVTQVVPILGRSLDLGFNVFDVMHHGTHEKQLSNVFAWLLDVGGTHELEDGFLRVFIDEVNTGLPATEAFPHDRYQVTQEVNVAGAFGLVDIADVVLESDTATLVVENYVTSDGHGHGYQHYLDYSRRHGGRGEVVLLCRDEDRSLLRDGWENAVVVTYSILVDRLHALVTADLRYRQENPDVYSFIQQMYRKYVSERGLVKDKDLVKFVTAMCDSGEARRYGWKRQEEVAEKFASDVAVQARERYVEGRQLLQRIKELLRSFADGPLRSQLAETLGTGSVQQVGTPYSYIYQWAVEVRIRLGDGVEPIEANPQFAFGPTAWFWGSEQEPPMAGLTPESVDHSRIFVGCHGAGIARVSSVSMQDLLDGLDPGDRRLHDDVLHLLEAVRLQRGQSS